MLTTTTEKPGTDSPTEVFYDYVIYTTSTLRPNEGSTQVPGEPVPDGTTYRSKPLSPFVQVKKRSLLDNEKGIITSTTEKPCEATSYVTEVTSEKSKSIVKRQASDTGGTQEATESSDSDTGSEDATQSSDTGSDDATESSDTGSEDATESSDTGESGDTTGSEETSDSEVPETQPVEEEPSEEETPEVSSPVEEGPVEGPVEEGPAEEAGPVEEPMAPAVMPLGGETVSPVEADTSVPGGMSSRAYIKRSISTSDEQKAEVSTNGYDSSETIPLCTELNCEENSNEDDSSDDIEENLDVINQMTHSKDEDLLTNSFTRITKVFVVHEIFVGNKKEDILDTFNKYKLMYSK